MKAAQISIAFGKVKRAGRAGDKENTVKGDSLTTDEGNDG